MLWKDNQADACMTFFTFFSFGNHAIVTMFKFKQFWSELVSAKMPSKLYQFIARLSELSDWAVTSLSWPIFWYDRPLNPLRSNVDARTGELTLNLHRFTRSAPQFYSWIIHKILWVLKGGISPVVWPWKNNSIAKFTINATLWEKRLNFI